MRDCSRIAARHLELVQHMDAQGLDEALHRLFVVRGVRETWRVSNCSASHRSRSQETPRPVREAARPWRVVVCLAAALDRESGDEDAEHPIQHVADRCSLARDLHAGIGFRRLRYWRASPARPASARAARRCRAGRPDHGHFPRSGRLQRSPAAWSTSGSAMRRTAGGPWRIAVGGAAARATGSACLVPGSSSPFAAGPDQPQTSRQLI